MNDQVGFGVFATRPIPRGTITWTLDPLDQIIDASKLNSLPSSMLDVVERYAFVNRSGNYVLCWDHARYMNHCCEPAALAPGVDVEVAIRDIQPGEQLTGDYGAYNIERDLACHCGAPSCRGTIRASDFNRLADSWDVALRNAVARVDEVDQPLWPLVSDASILRAAVADPLSLPTSALHCARRAGFQEVQASIE